MFQVFALLGRGIQPKYPGGPLGPTGDLEMCGERGEHLLELKPVDDENPFCFIGGGALILEAGVELCARTGAGTVVCAYGERSTYLRLANGPSESEVLSEEFALMAKTRRLSQAIEVWPGDKTLSGIPSNTLQELRNIFELTKRLGDAGSVGILTVGVHVPRAATFIQGLLREEQFSELTVELFSAEQVVLEANARLYAERILAMWHSKAWARTAERELRGTSAFLAGRYTSPKEEPVTP